MVVELVKQSIEVDAIRGSIESPEFGGVVLFLGEVRSTTRDQQTQKLVYEAYEEMALMEMHRIARDAKANWPGNVALVHRLGELFPGDVAVVAVAACPHRSDAFECCRFLIEGIKRDVPIWKKEFGPDGQAWVEGEVRVSESP